MIAFTTGLVDVISVVRAQLRLKQISRFQLSGFALGLSTTALVKVENC
jgi:hypothetical protein